MQEFIQRNETDRTDDGAAQTNATPQFTGNELLEHSKAIEASKIALVLSIIAFVIYPFPSMFLYWSHSYDLYYSNPNITENLSYVSIWLVLFFFPIFAFYKSLLTKTYCRNIGVSTAIAKTSMLFAIASLVAPIILVVILSDLYDLIGYYVILSGSFGAVSVLVTWIVIKVRKRSAEEQSKILGTHFPHTEKPILVQATDRQEMQLFIDNNAIISLANSYVKKSLIFSILVSALFPFPCTIFLAFAGLFLHFNDYSLFVFLMLVLLCSLFLPILTLARCVSARKMAKEANISTTLANTSIALVTLSLLGTICWFILGVLTNN